MGLLLMLADSPNTVVDLDTVSTSGETRAVAVNRTCSVPPSTRQYQPVEEVESGLLYIDVTRANASALSLAQRQLGSAKGAIIDARGYPLDRSWSRILADRPLLSMNLEVQQTSTPDQTNVTMRNFTTTSTMGGTMPEHVVFLVDASAFSAGEHQLSYFREAGIGTFVGTPTAGVNGNINKLGLPSGAVLTWTGMIAKWSDGSLFHTVGIQPDVLVEPTREAIAAGRDEIFETALRILKENLSASGS